ncbi:transmembrane protein 174 [Protobothrops mucrosquamatus]|uniref:transmembrane protein 174 n=1 Tax=Protobothrops mucrosquamatus TaxID=103944 RepID=UPI000775BB28|nr:transmembrane protein 174 [Protobothrops mucrosquamatus]
MEQNHNTVEDISANGFFVSPCQPNHSEIPASDDDKAGGALLFSGIILGVIGITFTVIGWVKYEGAIHFEWTRLLGPTLLLMGVTFLLIAVCKFKIFSCNSCNQNEERSLDTERTYNGLYPAVRQPITLHGAAMVPDLPSPTQERVATNSANLQEVLSHSEFLPGSSSIIPILNHSHSDNVTSMGSSAFSEENYSAYLTLDIISERSTNSLEEAEEILDEDLTSLPPPYEKLFPLLP